MIRTYSELIRLPTFDERFEYLKLDGVVGSSTFGFDRYINQLFYISREWKLARDKVILRDNACDLGIDSMDIYDGIRVHHMNPISLEDFEKGNLELLLDPEFLISSSLNTHNAIHFGNRITINKLPQERRKGDTTLWTKVY